MNETIAASVYLDPIARAFGQWAQDVTVASVVLRLCLALLLSAVMGWERAMKRHAAGLRTFIIVALSATVSMVIDLSVFRSASLPLISGFVILAIAIISSNTILYSSRNQTLGLTTAFTLWSCGLLGFVVGAGYYTIALLFFAALFLCVSGLPAFEKFLKDRSNHFEFHLELKRKEDLQTFIFTVRELGMVIDDIEFNPAYMQSGLSVYTVAVTIHSGELKKYKTHREIIEALNSLEYIYFIEEI